MDFNQLDGPLRRRNHGLLCFPVIMGRWRENENSLGMKKVALSLEI
jgi:hypothetical protein